MAVGSSNILGIQTPMNFNKPFLSVDIRISGPDGISPLSTWLRDFVFSRVLMQVIRKQWFKNRLHNAIYAYMVNICWSWVFGMVLVLATLFMVLSWCLDGWI